VTFIQRSDLAVAPEEHKKVKKPKNYMEKRILKKGFPKNAQKK
jgi:hypothetical protein